MPLDGIGRIRSGPSALAFSMILLCRIGGRPAQYSLLLETFKMIRMTVHPLPGWRKSPR